MMFNTTPERACGPNELSLAEELAHRAALALDNARLYKVAQKARDRSGARQSREGFVPRHAQPRAADAAHPGVDFRFSRLEHDRSARKTVQPRLQMIRRNVELEARLIDDLLDLTRISKGKVQLSLESGRRPCPACATPSRFARRKSSTRISRLDLDLPPRRVHLEADPARLQQVFWNLIKNAVKFTPEGGRLTDCGPQYRRESARDRGHATPGVASTPKSLPRRSSTPSNREIARAVGGLGLGLAITQDAGRDAPWADHSPQPARAVIRGPPSPPASRFPSRMAATADVQRCRNSACASASRSASSWLKTTRTPIVRSPMLLRRRGYSVFPARDICHRRGAGGSESRIRRLRQRHRLA